MKSKLFVLGLSVGLFTIVSSGLASAHVTVKPTDVTAGSYPTFTTSVPNEESIPVTGVRIVIPGNMEYVTPTVKQGWNIETKKSGDFVTEISWTGGSIGEGLRDEFTFTAQVPDKPGELVWKAYQTYEDGSVVSWDQKPAEDHGHESEDESKGPYSVSTITAESNASNSGASDDEATSKIAMVLAGIAVILSAASLAKSLTLSRLLR